METCIFIFLIYVILELVKLINPNNFIFKMVKKATRAKRIFNIILKKEIVKKAYEKSYYRKASAKNTQNIKEKELEKFFAEYYKNRIVLLPKTDENTNKEPKHVA